MDDDAGSASATESIVTDEDRLIRMLEGLRLPWVPPTADARSKRPVATVVTINFRSLAVRAARVLINRSAEPEYNSVI